MIGQSELAVSDGRSDDIRNEIISENPLQCYSAKVFYEQKHRENLRTKSTEERDIDGRAEFDELLDVAVQQHQNQYYPSSME